MSTAPVYLALGAQVAISSATYLIAKGAMSAFAPLELAVLRITGASCVFALLLAIRRCRLQPPAAELPRFFVLGMLGAPLNQGLFLFGLQRTTATHAAVLYALTPLLVFLISWAKGTERPSALRLAGIVMALVGVYVVLAEKGLSGGLENIVGDLLIFAAVTAWAFYSVLGKQLAREHGPLQTTAWGIMLGGAVMVCLAPVAVSPARLAVAGPSAWAAVAFLVLLTSVLSYLLWYYALARIDASRVAIWANLQPIGTASLAWLFTGTAVTVPLVVGGSLVISGVVLTQRAR